MRQHFQRVHRHQRQLTADHIGDGLAAATVGHMLQVDARRPREELQRHVRRGAIARRAVGNAVGSALGGLDQLADRRVG